jgi:hypothetical protein
MRRVIRWKFEIGRHDPHDDVFFLIDETTGLVGLEYRDQSLLFRESERP